MRPTFFIIGILAAQLVASSSQTATNVEQILAVVHSNDLAFLNTNNTDFASNLIAAYAGQEAVTYAAPESGYEPSSTFMFSTNAPYKWFEEFNQGFFLVSRNGQVYSKLGLSFRISRTLDDFMYVTFSGVASTNGSRNWEATAPQ